MQMVRSECLKCDPEVGHMRCPHRGTRSHAHRDPKSASKGPYRYQMVELGKARATDTPVCECTICCLEVSERLYEMVVVRSHKVEGEIQVGV